MDKLFDKIEDAARLLNAVKGGTAKSAVVVMCRMPNRMWRAAVYDLINTQKTPDEALSGLAMKITSELLKIRVDHAQKAQDREGQMAKIDELVSKSPAPPVIADPAPTSATKAKAGKAKSKKAVPSDDQDGRRDS